jgi:hypothetical protein
MLAERVIHQIINVPDLSNKQPLSLPRFGEARWKMACERREICDREIGYDSCSAPCARSLPFSRQLSSVRWTHALVDTWNALITARAVYGAVARVLIFVSGERCLECSPQK